MALLTQAELAEALGKLPGWTVEGGQLRREYRFPDFGLAFGFMAAAAPGIEKRDHHPEWTNVYNRVVVLMSTHDEGGITRKDVELAGFLESVAVRLQ